MSERYERIFTGEENLYTEGSPVLVCAHALLKDNETGKVIAQAKFKNISDNKIKYLKLGVTAFDPVKNKLGDVAVFEYLDLDVVKDQEFGSKKPLTMPNPSTRSIGLCVVSVGFGDGSVWSGENAKWEHSAKDSPVMRKLHVEKIYSRALAKLEYAQSEQDAKDAAAIFESIKDDRDVSKEIALCEQKAVELSQARIMGIYDRAMKMLEDSYCESDVNAARRLVESIKDETDVTECLQRCDEKIAQLKEKDARNRKAAIISGIIIAAIVVIYLLVSKVAIPFAAYSSGDYKTYINTYGVEQFDIPDSVTSIGNSAFSGCTSLASITIPDSVTSIGWSAFESCSGITSITISDGVTSIGDSAFSGCTSLTSITIPDSVTSIGLSAFFGCSGITSITISDGVTSISDFAFKSCSGITSITIPDSVTSIGEYAFCRCTSLKTINFSGTKAQWNAISKGDGWDSITPPTYIVYCTDGKIAKK